MISLIATAATFAAGLFFVPILIPDVQVRGGSDALKAAIVGGLLSAGLGKVLWIVLSLVFFPIRLLGPLGPFLAQAIVNLVLLLVAEQRVPGIKFKTWMSSVWAALALTILQALVAHIG